MGSSEMLTSSHVLLTASLLLISVTTVCLPLPMPSGATTSSMTESMAAFDIAEGPDVYVWPGEEEQILQSLELLQRLVGRNYPLPLLATSLRMYRTIKSRDQDNGEEQLAPVRLRRGRSGYRSGKT